MATNNSQTDNAEINQPKRDSKARTASAAVFFNENKSIAGFGNSMRAVFTSVRELVENSLDASEKRGVTPEIKVNLRRLERKELIELMGTNVIKTKDKRVDFIELSCRDNGVGVPRELIPQLFGTVLAGTKYGAQQTRGRFGLGSKMVLLYAMSTLDLPIQITTRPEGEDVTYRVRLFINLEKNAPIIHSDETFEEGDEEYFSDCGTEIKVSFTGSWNLAKLYVREYFRQLAIITPYADMLVDLPEDDEEGGRLYFQRVVDDIPKPPEVVKVHPWGTDISAFRREMMHATEDNLIDFLTQNFMGVSEKAAIDFFEEVGVETDKKPQELTSQEIRRIVHDGFSRALKESRDPSISVKDRIFGFKAPKGDSLSPLGADRLRKGLEKELDPEFVQSITRDPKAYEGHPFIIEAAIGYGGGVNKAAQSKGVTIVDNRVIYRFANRIPLIFGAGSDLITNVANSINWSDYGLTRGTEPLAIAVSLVSTKIPFPETSKEYIDKVEEIGAEVRLTLMQLGRNLKRFLSRRRRRQRERKRKSRFERYAPRTVENLLRILEKENLWDPATGVPTERIIAALASGKPRIGSTIIPLRDSIYQAPIWSLEQTRQLLQDNNIYELASFLRASNKKIAKILKIDELEVDKIKRRTIAELDKAEIIPDLNTDILLSSDDEIRFHRRDDKEKLIDLPRLYKACNRRWIRNAYDYLVSPNRQLNKVQGLAIKLVEAERVKIIKSLFEESDEVDIADELSSLLDEGGLLEGLDDDLKMFTQDELPDDIVDQIDTDKDEKDDEPKSEDDKKGYTIALQELFPPLEQIYDHEKLNKRKVNSILEFLLETTHPSSPVDEKVLAPVLIPAFQQNLKELVNTDPEYGNIKVNVSSQNWIDGYLRNAFKRRKIATVDDVIAAPESQLLEIGELQRTLFYGLRDSLIPDNGKILIDQFLTTNAKEKVKMLESAGINSLEKLAATDSAEISENEELFPFVDLIIEESKERLIESLTVSNNLGTLDLLKEIDDEIEEEMDRLEIIDSMQLLITPLEEFSKNIQDRIREAKLLVGTGFDGFYKKHQNAMSVIGVTVLEELVFNANYYLAKDDISETNYEELVELIEYINDPVMLISPHLVSSLDIMLDAGVNTVGRFLTWPQAQLAEIIDMPEEWIHLMRDSFDVADLKSARSQYLSPIERVGNILSEHDLSHIKQLEVESVAGATTIRWGVQYPNIEGKWSNISKINEILTKPLIDITDDVSKKKDAKNLTEALKDLREEYNITSLLQFAKLPISAVTSKLSTKTKRGVIENLAVDLRSAEPTMLSADSEYYRAAATFFAIEKLKAPIVTLSEFDIRSLELMSEEGIKSIHQLIILPDDEIAEILDLDEKTVAKMIGQSTFHMEGTPIAKADERGNLHSIIQFDREGDTYFKSEEISALSNAGYNTIESLYYMSDHRTFDVAVLDGSGSRVISWETIRHFKKLLESPPVLITWKKTITEEREIKKDDESTDEINLFSSPSDKTEVKENEGEDEPQFETVEIEYYENFSSKELELLTNSNIRRVIDFLTTPKNKIMDLLGWDEELTETRQTSVILQEAGIELSDLEIFRDDHIDHLGEMGVVTIEDLYFTAKEETWESEILPWRPIQTLKNIMHLPLHHVVQEIGEDILELLLENNVSNILEFILTGDPILEQMTGLPAERFENLKYALDFGSLIEAFDKTVYFTPNLTYYQCKALHDAGITEILTLVLSEPQEISKILDMPVKDVNLAFEQMTRSEIRRTEEERGVQIKDLNAFSRSDIRSIIQSGIFEMNSMDTIQEVLYQINADIFQGENYLLEMVLNLQKVCELDLAKIGDLNEFEVKVVKKEGVNTIADALLIGYEDLPNASEDFDNALKSITKSVIDMQSFIAMGKLPARSAMQEGEDESNLLNVWLDTPKQLHQRTMRNIRSILSLPVRLTSLSKLSEEETEELGNFTIADIILEYVPNEDHPHRRIQDALKETGILVKLLREGSTPLTLLDFGATEFRSLIDAGVNTIERVMMNDVKTLSNISGTTQKYWREIKEVFDPEVFNARLGDIGIPVSVVTLDDEEKEYLANYGITYFDQISIYDNPKGIIKELQDFLFAPTTFMVGNPGEKELAENHDARSIIEAVIALRQEGGASPELINEMVNLAWQAYSKYLFETPSKSSKNNVETLQDLCKVYTYNPDVLTKRQAEYAELYLNSPLLLPLPAKELRNIVIENRCVTIIDALTNPMVAGQIDSIRESIQNGEDPVILNQIELPNILLADISKTIWKRIEKSDLSLQQVLSSPRTLEVYKSTKQKYLQEAREALRIPLSLIHIDGDQPLSTIGGVGQYLRLDDLIYDLPNLYGQNESIVDTISSVLGNEKLEVLNDIRLPEEIVKAGDTAFGHQTSGFHDLWVSTWENQHLLQKIDTKPANQVKEFIRHAFSPVDLIDEIKPAEVWELWKMSIITISDLLMSPKDDLGSTSYFTKKRVGQLKSAAIKTLEDGTQHGFQSDNLTIAQVAVTLGTSDDSEFAIVLLAHQKPHPMFEGELSDVSDKVKEKLDYPIMNTKVGQELSIVEIDQLHGLGILNIRDFLVYPEKLKDLPKKFQKVDQRLEILKEGHELVSDFAVYELNLPGIVLDVVGNSVTVAEMLFELSHSSNRKLAKAISVPLSYADVDEDILNKLEKENITSTYDLLHYSPAKLSEILGIPEKKVKDLLSEVDFAGMFDKIENAPLQVNDIESISKGGRELLRADDIYTALDLYLPLSDELNRIDTSYLTTLTQVLESPVNYLQVVDGLSRDDISELADKYRTVRDLYYDLSSLSKSQQNAINSLTVNDLVNLTDKHRDFHDIEEIIIKDEKTLVNAGIFSFEQLSEYSVDQLVDIGLAKSKAEVVVPQLQSHWRNIVDLPKEAEEMAEELNLMSIAEVLHAPEIMAIEISTPIKIKKEISLSQVLKEVPKVVEDAGVNSISEFIRSDELIEAFADGDNDVIEIVSILNSSIDNLPGIKNKWVPKLREDGIYRIWQFIVEDAKYLSDVCGTSIKAQETFKESLDLSKFKQPEFNIPTLYKKDKALFEKYGFYSLPEILQDGLLSAYFEIEEELNEKIETYRSALDTPIAKLNSFWELEPEKRRVMAKQGSTLKELAKHDLEGANKLIEDAIKENFREMHSLDIWIKDDKELKRLQKKGISSVEEWMFANTRGEIEPGSPSFVLFRSTLDAVPYFTIKHIVSGYQSGMTHISDLLLEDNKELAKKLRTTSKKVEELLESVPDIGSDRPELPNLGLVSTSIVESMREGGIYSWAQILGNAVQEEIEAIKGVTWNTVQSVREYADVPLWHSFEIRALGISNLKKLVADGVQTIADILVLGDKFKEFVGDEEKYHTILDNISRANLRKGKESISIRLSESYKIRVKDIPDYEKEGILSPIDILIGNVELSKDSPLTDGVEDWVRLGEMEVDEINFPMKVIKNLKKMGIKQVQDAILAPDAQLREAGATNHQVKAFRKDLNRLKKGDKRVA